VKKLAILHFYFYFFSVRLSAFGIVMLRFWLGDRTISGSAAPTSDLLRVDGRHRASNIFLSSESRDRTPAGRTPGSGVQRPIRWVSAHTQYNNEKATCLDTRKSVNKSNNRSSNLPLFTPFNFNEIKKSYVPQTYHSSNWCLNFFFSFIGHIAYMGTAKSTYAIRFTDHTYIWQQSNFVPKYDTMYECEFFTSDLIFPQVTSTGKKQKIIRMFSLITS